jgi:hypothetical protein
VHVVELERLPRFAGVREPLGIAGGLEGATEISWQRMWSGCG